MTSLVIHQPDTTGANKTVEQMVARILDGWRHLTPKQVGIAATVYGYSKPAEMMTKKQEWNLKQAIAILERVEGEPDEPEDVL